MRRSRSMRVGGAEGLAEDGAPSIQLAVRGDVADAVEPVDATEEIELGGPRLLDLEVCAVLHGEVTALVGDDVLEDRPVLRGELGSPSEVLGSRTPAR